MDTNLVEVLLNKPDTVNHQKGISSIAILMRGQLSDTFVVALIDDDKQKLALLKEFSKVERLSRTSLTLFRHAVRKHFFIQLSPAIETWLIEESAKGEINFSDYGLPDSINGLKRLKGLPQRKDPRFSKLFKDMLQNEKCDEIIELKRWLIFFRDNTYNSNIDLL